MFVQHLPQEILLEICQQLLPEDIFRLMQVDKTMRKIRDCHLFWKSKYAKHFPHYFDLIKDDETVSWYEQFISTYKQEYSADPLLFSLVKEGCTVEQFVVAAKNSKGLLQDKNGVTIKDWARRKNNQLLLDYFYGQHLPMQSMSYPGSPLYLAIYYRQSDDVILNLIGNIKHVSLNRQNIISAAFIDLAKDGRTQLLVLFAKKFISEPFLSGVIKDAFLHAIENKQTADIEFLVSSFPDLVVSIEVENSASPLHIAIRAGHVDIFNILLKYINKNTDIVKDYSQFLYSAVEGGHPQMVQYLMQKFSFDISCVEKALLIASTEGNHNIVDMLLTGFDIEFTASNEYGNALNIVAQTGQLKILERLLGVAQQKSIKEIQKQYTLLQSAIKGGHFNVICYLLKQTITKIDESTMHEPLNPLFLAIKAKDTQTTDFLIQNGASLACRINVLVNDLGDTPLHFAVSVSSVWIVGLVLSHKTMDVHAKNKDLRTPLHLAVLRNNYKMAKMLIDAGADVTVCDADGNTPLHLAAQHGDTQMGLLLIAKGADPELLNARKRTPKDETQSEGFRRMLYHFNKINKYAEKQGKKIVAIQNKIVATQTKIEKKSGQLPLTEDDLKTIYKKEEKQNKRRAVIARLQEKQDAAYIGLKSWLFFKNKHDKNFTKFKEVIEQHDSLKKLLKCI